MCFCERPRSLLPAGDEQHSAISNVQEVRPSPLLHSSEVGAQHPADPGASSKPDPSSHPHGNSAPDISCVDSEGRTPLYRAAEGGHAAVVAQLLQAGASAADIVNLQSQAGLTPLMAAARQGQIAAVHELLEVPACRLDICSHNGSTAVTLAAASQCAELVLKLMRALEPHMLHLAFPNQNCRPCAGRCTLLHLAAYSARQDILELVLSCPGASAAIHLKDANGDTPLHCAARSGCAPIVAQLLQASRTRPDTVNLQNEMGRTALTIAVLRGHASAVEELLKVPECRLDVICCQGDHEQPEWERHVFASVGGFQHPTRMHTHDNLPDAASLQWAARRKQAHPLHPSKPLRPPTSNKHSPVAGTLLHVAAQQGDAEIAVQLLQNSASPADFINVCSSSGDTALQTAVKSEHVEVVWQMLRAVHPDRLQSVLLQPSLSSRTALHIAAGHGHSELVELLLSTPHGHAAQATDGPQKCTMPLHLAASSGHAAVVLQLLQAGATAADANVNQLDEQGFTALMLAAKHGHAASVSALLEVSACRSDLCCPEGLTALGLAASAGHLEVVEYLVMASQQTWQQSGPKPERDRSALHCASTLGNTAIVQRILFSPWHSAAITVADKTGCMPLHIAARHGHAAVVVQLLEAGAAAADIVNQQDHRGLTALMAAAEGGHAAVVRELCQMPCIHGACSKYGWTAMDLAARGGHSDVLQHLLSCLPPNQPQLVSHCQDHRRHTPLHHAATGGHQEAITMLLSAPAGGEAIGLADRSGSTPLHWAAVNGHTPSVLQLLQAGASAANIINLQNDDGFTALMAAAGKPWLHHTQHKAVVAELLKCPACMVGVQAHSGSTAVTLAAANNQADMLWQLMAALPPHQISTAFSRQAMIERTPLHLAAEHGRDEIVIRLLAAPQGPAAVGRTDPDGCTPLHRAAFNGHAAVVAGLLQANSSVAVVNLRCSNGPTALIGAIQAGHSAVVHELLQASTCKLPMWPLSDQPLLGLAAATGDAQTVSCLLQALLPEELQSALLDQDQHGQTPLHRAAELGKAEVAERLLKAPSGAAVVGRTDKNGRTPLHLAACNGHARSSAEFCRLPPRQAAS